MQLWTPKIGLVLGGLLAVAVLGTLAGRQYADVSIATEADRLVEVMHLQPGATVAEIGAGDGSLTLLLSDRLGSTGHLYSTELDTGKLGTIRRAVNEAGCGNVTVIEAAATETNLPSGSCDAIAMRKVYHHFRDAAAMDRSLMASLKAGGTLAVIDFPPGGWRRFLPEMFRAPRIPGGHGILQSQLARELTESGFEIEQKIDDWTATCYCVVARKPKR